MIFTLFFPQSVAIELLFAQFISCQDSSSFRWTRICRENAAKNGRSDFPAKLCRLSCGWVFFFCSCASCEFGASNIKLIYHQYMPGSWAHGLGWAGKGHPFRWESLVCWTFVSTYHNENIFKYFMQSPDMTFAEPQRTASPVALDVLSRVPWMGTATHTCMYISSHPLPVRNLRSELVFGVALSLCRFFSPRVHDRPTKIGRGIRILSGRHRCCCC